MLGDNFMTFCHGHKQHYTYRKGDDMPTQCQLKMRPLVSINARNQLTTSLYIIRFDKLTTTFKLVQPNHMTGPLFLCSDGKLIIYLLRHWVCKIVPAQYNMDVVQTSSLNTALNSSSY